jgi:hypothetical protein
VKYNPIYHNEVVRNYRRTFKEKFGEDLCLGDEEIWQLAMDWTDDVCLYEELKERHEQRHREKMEEEENRQLSQ